VGIYQELGLTPIINADARWTGLGASRMSAEVLDAMREAAADYIDVPALHRAAGRRLAELTNNEDAYVSANATAGIVISIVACITRGDERALLRLPDVDGDRREVLIHSGHRIPFDSAIEVACGRIVQFGDAYHSTPGQMRAAITDKTAAVFYVAGPHTQGALSLEQTVEIAHEAGVPVVVDAAAQLPPISNLWRFSRDEGADLVIFSGGKDLAGPQASGLIVGSTDWIDACRKVGPPSPFWPRPMKTGREEIAGLVKAVERYVQRDEPAHLARLEDWVERWRSALEAVGGVAVDRLVPSLDGQPVPRLRITLANGGAITGDELATLLASSDRPIRIGRIDSSTVYLNPETMTDEECSYVLDRVTAAIAGARSASK
jgi:L-seryl-tRNA(Ser) seleniumtransferase